MYAIECWGNDLQWHGQSSGGYMVPALILEFNVSAPPHTHVQVLEDVLEIIEFEQDFDNATCIEPWLVHVL